MRVGQVHKQVSCVSGLLLPYAPAASVHVRVLCWLASYTTQIYIENSGKLSRSIENTLTTHIYEKWICVMSPSVVDVVVLRRNPSILLLTKTSGVLIWLIEGTVML